MYLPDRSARVHTFKSITEAAKETGIHRNAIEKGLRGGKVVKGFFFSKEELDGVPDKIVPIEDLRAAANPQVSRRDWSVHQVNL